MHKINVKFVFTSSLYLMLPVSLDCPFLITPSVFSNVYSFSVVHMIVDNVKEYF